MNPILWLSIAFILYTYFCYPFLVFLLAKLRGKTVDKKVMVDYDDRTATYDKEEDENVYGVSTVYYPSVTLLIAAHNEEKVIKGKLENCLALRYPKEKLEIIVASDGSTDKTDEIVEDFADAGVKLIKIHNRGGKPRALNMAAPQAKGEIILFSDARQIYDKEAILELVRNFNDKEVGAVSGELHLLKEMPVQQLDTDENDISGGEIGVREGLGLYWKYEKFIRRHESQFYSTLGATGAIYAIRRELFSPIPEDTILDDCVIPMQIVLKGYRVIFEPKARAFDVVSETAKKEFTRKARTLAGNYQAFFRMNHLFNPFKNRVFFQLLSHKVFRLLVPYALALALISNVFASLTDARSLQLLNLPFYRTVLLLQIVFYACAAVGFFISKSKNEERVEEARETGEKSFTLQSQNFFSFYYLLFRRLFSTLYVFVVLNWAAVVGLYRFITNRQKVAWQKADGRETVTQTKRDWDNSEQVL